jgi:hypothetical protein
MTRSPHPNRWQSPLLIYLVSGLVGGIAAVAWGALAFSWPTTLESVTDPIQSAVPWFVLAAGAVGGVVAGWFVAALVLSRAPGKLRCPRCGTANDRRMRSCLACGLSFV